MPRNFDDSANEVLSLSTTEMEQAQGGAVCHGVSVLAWARVNGPSPISDDVIVDGRIITAQDWKS